MSDQSLLASLEPWIESRFGVPTSALGLNPIPVLPVDDDELLLAGVKIGEAAAVAARPDLVDRLRPVVASLPPDMLFAPLGCYDLARVTLPEGFGIWGPSWLLFGDETTVHPATDGRPVQVSEEDLADADRDVFWHTHIEGSMGRFAVFEDDRLVALATVEDKGDPVWEIGMDVAPDAKGRGLGRAVVAAAAEWILREGRTVMASVGSFNIPSARTLRSVGLRYLINDMRGVPGPFRLPPQPLGRPYPGTDLYDYYPRWAMNQDIQTREAASQQ